MAKQSYALDYREIVTLGGIAQHIRVRGTSENNPLLLFLHGGPGVSDRHWVLKDQSGLSDVCTMVCWDQRGSGKSYSKAQSREKMTLDNMVGDAKELIDYLCTKFNKEKVFIVGHSWGSVLGVLLSQRYPQRIAAYVGMGQLVNLDENERLAYKFVWDEANRLGDKKALRDLTRIGEPVNGSYGSLDNLITQRNYMTKYGGGAYNHKENIWSSVVIPVLVSPEYSLLDLLRYARGSFYSLGQLWDEIIASVRFDQTVTELEVPVYITQGVHDQNTPSSIAQKWFDTLRAPHKEWIAFEQSAHSPIKEEPELWGRVIRERLFTS
ncbi:MAG: alpha/beta hydrolase [Coriobacteriia bacterium]|nr:alpha/beta hydrolase [Coriobacteriia bacterium]